MGCDTRIDRPRPLILMCINGLPRSNWYRLIHAAPDLEIIVTEMRFLAPFAPALVIAGLSYPWGVLADVPAAPEITSQGFRLGLEQTGTLGQFPRIRIRVEAQGRIEVLQISERSYEVDLASTPERAHFRLFGLKKRPKSRQDVTLDFQNYINAKVDQEGQYSIHIHVVDEKRNSADAVLLIRLTSKEPEENRVESSPPIETTRFTFQRIGAGEVTGAGGLGITWKTVESAPVTIQLTKAESGAAKLVDLQSSDFDGVETKMQLSHQIVNAEGVEEIKFATANDKAADTVFAVVNRDTPYILKVETSETRVTPLGTTVTLNGKIKH